MDPSLNVQVVSVAKPEMLKWAVIAGAAFGLIAFILTTPRGPHSSLLSQVAPQKVRFASRMTAAALGNMQLSHPPVDTQPTVATSSTSTDMQHHPSETLHTKLTNLWLKVLPAGFALLCLIWYRLQRSKAYPLVEQQPFVALTVAAQEVPKRIHPVPGSSPPWMNRSPGRAPEPSQFMYSDPSKPDLTGKLPECPLTRAVKPVDNIEQLQKEAREAVLASGTFPLEIMGTPEADAQGAAYFVANREQIQADLQKYGCIWFRGFSLMQDIAGYRAFWEALGMTPCLDPIHSSGLRKFASARDGLYEEVNKPQLRQHYIGLHQESSSKRSAAAAAFVCFQRATVEGGRFFVADAAAILADMNSATVQRLTESGVRISVSNIDTPMATDEGISGVGRNLLKGMVETLVAPKFDMDLEMVWDADGKAGRLQAIEEVMPPVIRHPQTGVPIWFCNAHNHLRYLRDRRPCAVPEVGMTEVYLGEHLDRISPEDSEEIRRACEKNIVAVPMEPGDVLLIDNYRALHGRDTFEGDRYHAVTWFTWDNPDWREGTNEESGSKDLFNKVINQYMDWLPKDF